ncbi:MAG: ABC transporter permease [Betaproteobacteria bacterium]|nr:ABC transporter permease [Betaproteobacteria bacterium]
MKVLRLIGRRIVALPVPLLIITLVVFLMVRLSGDPTELYLPPDATEEQREGLRQQFGLDRSLAIQYLHFLWDLARGDFGRSIRFDQPALTLIAERLPATIELTMAGLVLTLAIGIPLGLIAARRSGKLLDHVIVNVCLFLQSMPSFWVGLVLITWFGVQLGWLPTSGRGGLEHLLLPAITVCLFLLPQVALLMRSSALEVLGEDYVRTAWAKGVSSGRVFYRHVLANALNPVVSYLGLQVGRLLGGAVITETVFAWPGLGQLSLQAVFQRDMAVVQASVVVLAVLITLANLVADLVNVYIDPRIRMA